VQAGTLPADVKAKLHRAIADILNEPATKTKLLDLGFEMVLNTPEEFAKYQATEYARWQKLIRERKITAD
jgi:tripartite-type tricarboxylate transporter receptor subunit TctC